MPRHGCGVAHNRTGKTNHQHERVAANQCTDVRDHRNGVVVTGSFRKTGEPDISESPLHPRRKSRRIMVEVEVPVGGGAPISVQSMTNTLTANVPATLQQIAELTAAGCDIVRVAVPSQDDADVLPQIVAKSPIPIIADIHFQSKYVFQAIDAGCAACA